MKLNKYILEAINRGISIALDDYEDIEKNEPMSSKHDIIKNNDMKNYIQFRQNFVDLDLPSGTLWCKYNLGVEPSKLDKVEDWNGNYYAWGELEANKIDKKGEIYFGWDNYKFGKANFSTGALTKYCSDPDYGLNGFTDNLTQLLPEDDVAYQNKNLYNFKCHIPTEEQFKELINYTQNYWVNNYNPNKLVHNSEDDEGIKGLNGIIFEGKNKKQLFIPAAYYRECSHFWNINSEGCYWSSSLYSNRPCYAQYLYFCPTHVKMITSLRYRGLSIRAVMNKF